MDLLLISNAASAEPVRLFFPVAVTLMLPTFVKSVLSYATSQPIAADENVLPFAVTDATVGWCGCPS